MSSVVETSHEISWTSQATSRFRTSYSMFPRSLRSFENILRQAKRHSRNRTVLHVSSLTLENIPHEEVFRGMQIL